MSKYIKIRNDIEIEPQAFTLIGASTKREDSSKIGFFGSGLKYALAVILRNNINMSIFSGRKEIKVTTKKEKFRGMDFNNIFINGEKTSMTKEMGVDWKVWFAIREIYCNALDEENPNIEQCDKIEPQKGQTHFYLKINREIDTVLKNWDYYFTNQRKDLVLSSIDGNIYTGNKQTLIYRKGIQCYEMDYKQSLYHYDLKDVMINESRVAKCTFSLKSDIAKFLGKYANKNIINNIFKNYCDKFEEELYWEHVDYYNFLWLEVIDNRIVIEDTVAGHFKSLIESEPCLILPRSMVESLRRIFGDKIRSYSKDYSCDYVKIDKTDKHKKLIGNSLIFLSEAGFDIKYPVDIAIFDNKRIAGYADINKKKIVLSDLLFDQGRKEIVSTILEETFHLESHLKDETREFQNFLINKLVNALEEKTGIYL